MIFIKVEVYGKHTTYTHKVNPCQEEIKIDGGEKLVFFAKPRIDIDSRYDYEKISEFEVDSGFVNTTYNTKMFFEDEEVSLLKKKLRLDTGVLEMYISKVLSETDENKETAETELEICIFDFNEEMIKSNEKLDAYCKVHLLNPRDTDVLELWKIVYPENDYNIMDGNMVCVPNPGKDDFMITKLSTKADVSPTIGTLGTRPKMYCKVDYGIDATVSSAKI